MRAPDGVVTPDFSGSLPGRGAWVRADRNAVEKAVKRGAFARSFKDTVSPPDNLAERIDAAISKAALSALGIARKCGDVVMGYEKTRAALLKGQAAILVTAQDAGADSKKKLTKLAGNADQIDAFTGAELASALGRDTLVHAAIRAGANAKRFRQETQKLLRFRDQDGSMI